MPPIELIMKTEIFKNSVPSYRKVHYYLKIESRKTVANNKGSQVGMYLIDVPRFHVVFAETTCINYCTVDIHI